jgi:outer membrane protein assembly factor BamB
MEGWRLDSSSRRPRRTRYGARSIVCAALVGLLATACNASPTSQTHSASPTPQTHSALYLFTNSPGSASPSATAHALGLSTGTPLWQSPLNGVVDGAAHAGDMLYVGSVQVGSGGSPTGKLTGLFASTGQAHWQVSVPSARAVPLAASSDAVYTQIVDTRSAPPQITLEEQRANDGTPLWSDAQSASANPLATLGDNALYLFTVNPAVPTATTPPTYALVAVNAHDGKTLWQLALQSPPTTGSAPLLDGGVLYLAEQYFAAPGQASSPTSTILAVRASDGKVLWHAAPPEPGAAGNVVVSGGLVCFGYDLVDGSGGGLAALHAADGSLAWHVSVAGAPLQLAAGNGMLFAQDTSQSDQAVTASLHAYDAGTGKTVFDRPFPALPGQLLPNGGGPVPQVAGGAIYLVDAAVSSQAGAAPAQPQLITLVMALRVNDGSLEWSRAIDGGPSQLFFVAP